MHHCQRFYGSCQLEMGYVDFELFWSIRSLLQMLIDHNITAFFIK